MTRNGKIARLPRHLREQINLRLQNGEEAKQIADWLNTLPEVQHLLAAEFDAQPINEPDLSHWKLGGYRDWEAQQEALAVARSFGADAAELRKLDGPVLTDQLALCLAARLAVALKNLPCEPGDSSIQRGQLRRLCADLVALRKGDHAAQRIRLERRRVELETKKFDHDTAYERHEMEEELNPRRKEVPKAILDQVVRELNLM